MPKISAVSIIDAVSDDLRRRVLSGELEPGTPMVEIDVAEQYEVARPTAKSAIENLLRERLFERSARKTARVVRLTPEDARDIYGTRQLIESQVVRTLARERRVPAAAREANSEIAALTDASPREVLQPDVRFHRGLVDGLGSERTSMLYAALSSEVVFCMSQIQGAALLPTEVIVRDHAELMRLIESGDEDGAAAILSTHIGRARERLVERLGGQPGPEASAPEL